MHGPLQPSPMSPRHPQSQGQGTLWCRPRGSGAHTSVEAGTGLRGKALAPQGPRGSGDSGPTVTEGTSNDQECQRTEVPSGPTGLGVSGRVTTMLPSRAPGSPPTSSLGRMTICQGDYPLAEGSAASADLVLEGREPSGPTASSSV